ncbi:MAG: HD domain-containing protein [Oribacterium sp.]|nr:HD domain-containing protein [Oribacterium sp.]
MNKQAAIEAFRDYSSLYDTDDIKIKLKIDHTYRVADIASRIGTSVGADPDFSWFLGLLHDIGRFEQLTQYGTFKDADSVDHAELGADILFKDGLINNFPNLSYTDGLENARIAETAIRLHNKLELPRNLDSETLLYCKILRDADKADIFRVLTEPPYDERNQRIESESVDMGPARLDIMRCVHEHRCVPRRSDFTPFEALISQCCMAFELEFPESVKIVREQGYLWQLMNLEVRSVGMSEQLETLRTEMERAWEDKCVVHKDHR